MEYFILKLESFCVKTDIRAEFRAFQLCGSLNSI